MARGGQKEPIWERPVRLKRQISSTAQLRSYLSGRRVSGYIGGGCYVHRLNPPPRTLRGSPRKIRVYPDSRAHSSSRPPLYGSRGQSERVLCPTRSAEECSHGGGSPALPDVSALHQQTREEYGAIKLWRAVKAREIRCGRHRVARVHLAPQDGCVANDFRKTASIVVAEVQVGEAAYFDCSPLFVSAFACFAFVPLRPSHCLPLGRLDHTPVV